MRGGILFPLLMLAAVGSLLVFGSSSPSGSNSLRLRRTQEEDTDAVVEPEYPLFADDYSLNPRLAAYLSFTWGDSAEVKLAKKERYQEMVRYHSDMAPCLHKSFYGMIGYWNPSLTLTDDGMTEEGEGDIDP